MGVQGWCAAVAHKILRGIEAIAGRQIWLDICTGRNPFCSMLFWSQMSTKLNTIFFHKILHTWRITGSIIVIMIIRSISITTYIPHINQKMRRKKKDLIAKASTGIFMEALKWKN
jgi:hypothetical protein